MYISDLMFTHVPPQHFIPNRVLHIVPHSPQFELSLDRFTQVPPQFVFPIATQAMEKPPGLTVPKTPEEVVVAVVTAAVVVTGAVVVSVAALVQVDALQVIPDGQVFPQVPQLPGLVKRS